MSQQDDNNYDQIDSSIFYKVIEELMLLHFFSIKILLRK